jgi:hypothetical protein
MGLNKQMLEKLKGKAVKQVDLDLAERVVICDALMHTSIAGVHSYEQAKEIASKLGTPGLTQEIKEAISDDV